MTNKIQLRLLLPLLLMCFYQTSHAGGIPLNTDDSITAAINSNGALLDVLSNDDSGIINNNYKEVIAVCATGTTDLECIGNSYTDGVGTVTVNGLGDNNNVLFSANNNQSYTFEFKYIMQNDFDNPGSGLVTVMMSYIEVNTLSDSTENGCDANNCTLREAMTLAANDNEPSLISFLRDMTGTISLTSGLVVSSNDLTVSGPGAAKISITGNDLFRVLTIPVGTERFTLSGLTLRNGFASGQANGGGILIENALETRFENIRVIDSTATGQGGGIFGNNAGITLVSSEISNNTSDSNGGGIGVTGGFGSDVNIENTTISNNASLLAATSGLFIDTTFGQTTTLKFITVAFNNNNNGVDSTIQGAGNIIIEASVFEPGLAISNDNNVTNNSIFQNTSGSIFGENNRGETGQILNPNLSEINDSGLHGHMINSDSLAYNHVDDMVGNASCGNQINTDQFGSVRPQDGACDAGAFEYSLQLDIIFKDTFE